MGGAGWVSTLVIKVCFVQSLDPLVLPSFVTAAFPLAVTAQVLKLEGNTMTYQLEESIILMRY